MADRLHLRPKHRRVLEALLREHLPNVEVWAYGSRVSGRSHEGSDLDLVLRGPGLKEIPIGQLGDFEEAVRESIIPFLVEARDWSRLPERFHREIARDHVVLIQDQNAMLEVERGNVVTEWQDVSFKQLLSEPVRNGIYKKKEFHGRGVKIINMGELFAHPRLRGVPMKRVQLSESETERLLVYKGDLLFARRSLVPEGAGKCCAVLEVDEPTTFESSIIRARPNTTRADYLYLYYFFNSPPGLHQLDTIRRQVAVAGITGSDLSNLAFPIPPLANQRAIAHILGALDDKIELNRRMNETLEAMARALFKSWFVDFDPVRARLEGRDPYLKSEIWHHFPQALDDEGLPEGWRRATLGEIITVLETGRRPRGGVTGISEGMPSVGAESITGVGQFDFSKTKYVPHDYFEKMATGRVSDGDVLIYKDGGKPGQLRPAVTYISRDFPFAEFCINEHVFRVRTGVFSQPFLYCLLSTEDAFWQMRELATGVAQPGLNQKAIKSLLFTLPKSQTLICAAESILGSLIDACNENSLNSFSLAQVRDALLPKLISGEIRLREAEKVVEAVA